MVLAGEKLMRRSLPETFKSRYQPSGNLMEKAGSFWVEICFFGL